MNNMCLSYRNCNSTRIYWWVRHFYPLSLSFCDIGPNKTFYRHFYCSEHIKKTTASHQRIITRVTEYTNSPVIIQRVTQKMSAWKQPKMNQISYKKKNRKLRERERKMKWAFHVTTELWMHFVMLFFLMVVRMTIDSGDDDDDDDDAGAEYSLMCIQYCPKF